MSPPDLSTPQDMAKVPSCRGEDAPGKTYRLVMNKLLLPGVAGHKAYTYDYAGDGRSVNQLKNLLTTIALLTSSPATSAESTATDRAGVPQRSRRR